MNSTRAGYFSQGLVLFSVLTNKLGIDALHSLYIKEQLNGRDIRRHFHCSARSGSDIAAMKLSSYCLLQVVGTNLEQAVNNLLTILTGT